MRLMAQRDNERYQCFLLEEGEIDAAITVICLDRENYEDMSPERQHEVWNVAERTLNSPTYELYALVDMQEDRLVGKAMIEYMNEDMPEITALHVAPDQRGKRLIDIPYEGCLLSLREQGYREAMVRISPGNSASLKAASRNGFVTFTPDNDFYPDLADHRFLKRAVDPLMPKMRFGVDNGTDRPAEDFDHRAS